MQFPTVIGHVPMHLICQSKSPILTDKWLKGFWNPSTYEKIQAGKVHTLTMNHPVV